MSTQNPILVGEMLCGGVPATEALQMAAELTEYLIQNELVRPGAERELEANFLMRTPSSGVVPVPGVRLSPVQIRAVGVVLTGLLLGRPLSPAPFGVAEHRVWLQDTLDELFVVLEEHRAGWRERVLALVEALLVQDAASAPTPAAVYLEAFRLAAFSFPSAPPAVAPRAEPARRRPLVGLAVAAAALLGLLLLPSQANSLLDSRVMLSVRAAPDASVLVDGVDFRREGTMVASGRHHILVHADGESVSGMLNLDQDTHCRWSDAGEVRLHCEPL